MSVNILLVQFIISEHFYTIRTTHFVYFVHFSFSINESSVCILAEHSNVPPKYLPRRAAHCSVSCRLSV